MSRTFPPLPLDRWRETRDTLHGYARLLGKIRRAETPPQKHWWHASLRAAVSGLTTTPIRSGDLTYALTLDLTHHHLLLQTSHGQRVSIPLEGQSLLALRDAVLTGMAELGLQMPGFNLAEFADETAGTYDRGAVETYWHGLSQIDMELKGFRHSFRGESSPVQLWPHHFDLAVNWFSGRLVPDQNPDDPEYADEQMNFGFSTGDDGMPEPYFYATAYPEPAGWSGGPLPAGARWHSEGWSGAVLPYAALAEAEDGRALLRDFLRLTHEAGAALMGGR